MISQVCLWVLVLGSLSGQLAIIHKKRFGFMIWTIIDFGWICYFTVNYSFPQIILWSIYTGFSFWGWIAWRKNEKT
jgi:hypothetical protein